MNNTLKYNKILLVEDSRAFRKILKISLSNECPCMSILEATTCHEAIKMMQSTDFSLFLLDIQLPDGSGLDLIQHIKHIQPHASVIVLTANDTEEFEEVALQNGANQFLSKRNFHIEDVTNLCECC